MFTPEEFAALYPTVTSKCLEIEAYVDTCLRRGQLRVVVPRSNWSADDVKAVHARYAAKWPVVELYPCPGVLMQFHTLLGDEITKG